MKEIFDSYLTVFMHPFKIYDFFSEGIPLQGRELSPIKRLTLTETITVSWLITILRSLFDLMILNFVLSAVSEYFTDNDNFFTLLGLTSSFAGYYFFLIKLVIETLTFPLFAFGWVVFWEFFIKHIGLFLGDEEAEQKAHLIVTNSLTTHFIKIIPIFGDIAQGLLSTIHIFAGMKKSFGLDSKSALLALSLPWLLFSFFVTFFVISIVLLFI
jgi:hypothetical protein